MCADNYPPELDGQTCPRCGEALHLQQDETVDPELAHYARPAQAALPAGPSGRKRRPEINVREADGLLWISQDVLAELGYYGLESFKQIEVDSVVYELQGFKSSSGEWWVERVES
jgi:hypothetical protein